MANQPIVVIIDASIEFMQYHPKDYEDGIYTGPCSSEPSNSSNLHAVLLMGYTEDAWILRNTWGTG